ncbi:MAG TPA: hypothetical protein VN924_10985 [Bryobacteraceae bacterium]|nr:hypothetical protein [Bryobacteraceae bacterium]
MHFLTDKVRKLNVPNRDFGQAESVALEQFPRLVLGVIPPIPNRQLFIGCPLIKPLRQHQNKVHILGVNLFGKKAAVNPKLFADTPSAQNTRTWSTGFS